MVSNLALDRIRNLEPMEDLQFVINDCIDFDHYFDNIVGVTIPDEPEVKRIIFRTNERRYPYIISKSIHPSQNIVDRKKHILRIDVAPNLELEQKILSFGPDIEVLEPISFREQIKKKVKLAYKNYFAAQDDCTEQK